MADSLAGFAENVGKNKFDLFTAYKEVLPILAGERGKQTIRMGCGRGDGNRNLLDLRA